MPLSPQVPDVLTGGPFTAADAHRAGLTSRMLRGRAWTRLLHGVYCHSALVVDDALRLRAARLALPSDAVASGLLAAWAHGAWTPVPGGPLPLDWSTRRGTHRPVGDPCGSHRLVVGPRDVVDVGGLPCTSPHRTVFDLMRRACLVESVVVADAFAAAGLVRLPELYGYVDSHRRWPGVDVVRRRLEHASRYSRSPGETRLRMVFVLGGLPEPYVNVPMYRGDELLAVPDLYLVGRREAVAEYDGSHHEAEQQHRHDLRRENRLSALVRMPVLRYDRFTVSRHALRQAAMEEMARAIDVRPAGPLRPVWFADPRYPLRW